LIPTVMSFRDYYLSSRARMSGRLILALAIGFATVGAINVLNLFTTWVLDRRAETALLQAIGIPRSSLARLVLLRYGVIFALGIGLSVLPTYAIFGLLAPRLEVLGFPYWLELRYSPQLTGWLLAAAGVTYLVTVSPAVLLSIREDLSTSAVAVQRASIRTGWTVMLTFGQTLLMAALGYVSISLLQSSTNLTHADLGFAPQGVLTVRFGLRAADFPSSSQRQQIVEEIIRQCGSIPAVENISVVSEAPGTVDRASTTVAINAAGLSTSGTHFVVHDFITSDAVFRTLRVPILAGDGLKDILGDRGPVKVVITQSLAKRLWPDSPCIGALLTIREDPRLPIRTMTVAGVIPDICSGSLYDSNRLAIFSSFTDTDQLFFYVLVNGKTPPDIEEIRRKIHGISPKIPIYLVRTYEQYIGETAVVSRLTTLTVAAFSLIAFVVGGAGIYSFAIYRVIRQRREFAIRLAIGGDPNSVWFRYARSYIIVSLAAAGAGIGVGIGIDRLLPDLLYGVAPLNIPSTGWTIAAIALCVMAALGPAFLRIRRIVPAEALKA
jgi:putative ABC transport system permease protein